MQYTIQTTPDFEDWLREQSRKKIAKIEDRLERISENGHFGDKRHLEAKLWELKWKDGTRVYYAYLPKKNLLILLGGNKNGQQKDIRKAERILRRYV